FFCKKNTGFGQLNASPDAVKKLGVVSILQCRDRSADGGLSQIKRFSRFRQMLSFGDGDEHTKLVECHPVHSYELQRTFSDPRAKRMRSVTVNFDDCLGEGLRGFLRHIVTDAL